MKKNKNLKKYLALIIALISLSIVFIGCDSDIDSQNYGTGSEGVNLRSAGDYVMLAKSAISTTGTTAITGDLGLSPAATSFYTGFDLTNATGYATSGLVTGKLYAADMADPTPIDLTTAIGDMITAYNDAASRSNPDFLNHGAGAIGGLTLAPGLYKWTTSVGIGANVTIAGDAVDTWVFQISGDLTSGAGFDVILSGGALAENIFWQVAGEVTLGTGSHFEGVVLTQTAITMNTGASVNGRLLAQTAINLDASTVVEQ